MVDLSKAKVGDTVVRYDGSKDVIIRIEECATSNFCYWLTFAVRGWQTFTKDGKWSMDTDPHENNIVKLIPKDKKAKVVSTPAKPKMTLKEFVDQCGGKIHFGVYNGNDVFVVLPKAGGSVGVYEDENDAYRAWIHENTSFTIAKVITKLLKG